jgi:hypothetical protein
MPNVSAQFTQPEGEKTKRYVEQFLGMDSCGYEVSTVPLVQVLECSNMTVPLNQKVLGALSDMVADKVADF